MKTNHWICICLTSILLVATGCDDSSNESETGDVGNGDTGEQDDTQSVRDSESESTENSDKDIPAETDTAEDEDTDEEQGEPQTAYFLVDSAGLGGNGVGCDLNNDGRVDNNLGRMVNDFMSLGILKGDPSEEIQESIKAGAVLIVFKLADVNSFQNDKQVLLEEYKAAIEGFTPKIDPPPADLFSGYGTVSLDETASSQFEKSTIEDWRVQTPDSPMIVPISIAGEVVNVELATGSVQANVESAPGDEMLGGNLSSGLICGGIEKQYLMDLLIEKANIKDSVSQGIAKAAVNSRVDLKCGDDSCISVGVVFSAVSVAIE